MSSSPLIWGGSGGIGKLLPASSSGLLQTDASGNLSTTASAASAFNITSQTTTYSANANDYIICSSTSFTITLPTAVGASGKQIGIQHNGTSLTQAYTLNTTSSQTIGGIASGSYALYTNGEMLLLVSDGSNWQIVSHKTDIARVSYTPTFSAAWGTTTNVSVFYRRDGSEIYVNGQATFGTTSSGLLSISLPSGISIDTTRVPASNTTSNPGSVAGNFGVNAVTDSAGYVVTATGTSSSLLYLASVFVSGAGNQLVPATGSVGSNSNVCQFHFNVPISGWQP